MHRTSLRWGGLVGGLTSLPLLALFYLGEQFLGFPFVPFDMFDWLARVLPGDLITVVIDTMVWLINAFSLGATSDTAKRIEQLLALGLAAGGGAALGAGLAWVRPRLAGSWSAWRVGAVAGLAVAVAVLAAESSLGALTGGNAIPAAIWLALLPTGWGAILGALLAAEPVLPEEADAPRRALLLKIGASSAVVALSAWGLGRLLQTRQQATGAGQPLAGLSPGPAPSPAAPTPATTPSAAPATPAVRRIEPAPGTRPEVTPNDDFYRIDINLRPVVIDSASWSLAVEGLFDRPRSLTLADLMAYPSVTQAITLSCISNPVGGDLIGTSHWTGVRLADVLEDLGLRPEARSLFIEAADGFYESVVLEDMLDPRTLLVYGMNGEALPLEHGFPLRIYIPNRYGMKQPKWITRIEAIDGRGRGYWVDRGWSAEARPQIVSVVDTVARDNPVDGRIPIGGIAWAGDRGIERVEVQVDGGEWVEASLRRPPLSPLTWVQWRYDWPGGPGRHTIRVRATAGDGARQIETRHNARPDGATGYHQVTVTI